MNTDTERNEEQTEDAAVEESTEDRDIEMRDPESDEQETVEELHEKLAEAEERWQRARADYQNLKRRTQSDFEALLRRQVQPMLESLLLVVDHLEMALAIEAESPDAKSLAEGVRLTRDQLVRALEDEGVHPVAESGPFDPAVHQAVAMVEGSEEEPGQIVQTIRRGYTWNGIVLRPGQVRVAAAESGAQAAGGSAPKPEDEPPTGEEEGSAPSP
jgi:molecular chaperone GrpE